MIINLLYVLIETHQDDKCEKFCAMPDNNESETLQVLTDHCGADMNNFSVFQVSQSLKTVETTCKLAV